MRELHFPKREEIRLTGVLHALSDPSRLAMVRCLACGEERSCGALFDSMAKSTLSHHLKVLRESGLIAMRAQGTQYLNSLRSDDLDARFPGLLTAVLNASEPL